MSEVAEAPDLAEATRNIESVAALGYLLNAIAHDLNNQLTNLLLGADQLQYGGGADAVEMMVQQANRLAEITRSVQRLGQSNFGPGAGPSDLGSHDATRFTSAEPSGSSQTRSPGPRAA
jgi:signal transduction histidine kinase